MVSVNHSGTLSVSLYPNPAKEETNINVMVGQDSKVEIELFDSASKLIASIKPSDAQKAGETMYNLKLNDVPAGVYNVVITINGQAIQKKLIRLE